MQVKCRWCPSVNEINITPLQLQRWRGGELIQNAAPNLSPDDRELLISGTCPICWEAMFPPEDENE